MEQKIKFIIIGLIAVLVVSFALNIFTLLSKEQALRSNNTLQEDKSSLLKEVETSKQKVGQLQKQLIELNQGVDKLNKEKEEIQKKYDLVDKARQTLVDQVKALKEKEASSKTSASATAQPASNALGNDAYWAGILKQKKDLEWQLDTVRSELKTAQINNEQLQKEKSALELEAGNLGREKQDLGRQYEFVQKQLEYNKKMMESIALELVGEKNDKLQIQDSFKAIKTENAMLRRQLKNLNDRKISLERKLATAQEKSHTLESRFNEMDVLLKDKMLQLEKISRTVPSSEATAKEEPVELTPIVVRPPSETTTMPSITTPAAETSAASIPQKEGKISAVNRDNNFVIIDLGEEQSARVGDVFNVYNKANKPIGVVEIIETRKAISACDIQRENEKIQVGDKVRLKS
ncbi:MAG: hypothetical protein PHT31_04000 [Candidatus Omnitrophica bacterium]|nr:hypothetical protein [Candidatus Omnitrophota bacterium]